MHIYIGIIEWLLWCIALTRCLVHLSRGKAEVGMFAPDETQMHVVNHLTGSPDDAQSRYVCADNIEYLA